MSASCHSLLTVFKMQQFATYAGSRRWACGGSTASAAGSPWASAPSRDQAATPAVPPAAVRRNTRRDTGRCGRAARATGRSPPASCGFPAGIGASDGTVILHGAMIDRTRVSLISALIYIPDRKTQQSGIRLSAEVPAVGCTGWPIVRVRARSMAHPPYWGPWSAALGTVVSGPAGTLRCGRRAAPGRRHQENMEARTDD